MRHVTSTHKLKHRRSRVTPAPTKASHTQHIPDTAQAWYGITEPQAAGLRCGIKSPHSCSYKETYDY